MTLQETETHTQSGVLVDAETGVRLALEQAEYWRRDAQERLVEQRASTARTEQSVADYDALIASYKELLSRPKN